MKRRGSLSVLINVVSSLFIVSAILVFPTSCSIFGSKDTTKVTVCPPSGGPPQCLFPGRPYNAINLEVPVTALSNPKIFVYKTDRRLLVVNDGVLVRDYKVGLGPRPGGDKVAMGDGRTPEGEFFICNINPTSKFYKSLGISYPGPQDAERALIEGRITFEEYKQIMQSLACRQLPPSNTALGGAIFIHGGGSYRDWTEGCVAVSNGVMDELFQIVRLGTPVEILP